jgi:hypothetical protein
MDHNIKNKNNHEDYENEENKTILGMNDENFESEQFVLMRGRERDPNTFTGDI